MTQCFACFKKKCNIETCLHACHKFDRPIPPEEMTYEEEQQANKETMRNFLGI